MNALEILTKTEALGISLSAEGQHLRVRPKSLVTPDLIEKLRSHKQEILDLLALRGWPADALEAMEKFGHPYARLCPSIRRLVETPHGRGELVYIDAGRAGVVLEHAVAPTYLLPGEVRPIGAPAVVTDFDLLVH